MESPVIFLLALIFLHTNLFAAGRSQFGYKRYTEYIPGSRNSKIILTAPHGGHLKPSSIRNRPQYGCYKKGKCIWSYSCGRRSRRCTAQNKLGDANTQELARRLSAAIYYQTGRRPHLIICHLHRSKLDANRETNQATFGNRKAKTAYNNFHGFIRKAKKAIRGAGVLFDIHGLSSIRGFIDLGYVIPGYTLVNGPLNPERSSISSLRKRNRSIRFASLLRGSGSLGAVLGKLGHKAIPSPKFPRPIGTEYKRGGYIIEKYGSRNGGIIDAIQVESPGQLRRTSTYKEWAKDLGLAIASFVQYYYRTQSHTTTLVKFFENVSKNYAGKLFEWIKRKKARICKDTPKHQRNCASWKQQHCISSSQYFTFMKINCKKSCRFCQRPAQICKDAAAQPQHCVSWKQQQYCSSSSTYFQFMKTNCAKTCRFCQQRG